MFLIERASKQASLSSSSLREGPFSSYSGTSHLHPQLFDTTNTCLALRVCMLVAQGESASVDYSEHEVRVRRSLLYRCTHSAFTNVRAVKYAAAHTSGIFHSSENHTITPQRAIKCLRSKKTTL